MKVEMIGCDNPGCDSVVDAGDPYGWVRVKGHVVGEGPSFEIEICSSACAESAIDNAILMHYHHEQEDLDRWDRRYQHVLLSIPCPTCFAQPEEFCVTKNKIKSQQPHVARRDEAYRLMREADAGRD